MHFRTGRIVFEQILLRRCVYSINELLKGVKMPKITIFKQQKYHKKLLQWSQSYAGCLVPM